MTGTLLMAALAWLTLGARPAPVKGGGKGRVSMPDIPPPVARTPTEAKSVVARENEESRIRRTRGSRSTILTSGLGLGGEAATAKPTLADVIKRIEPGVSGRPGKIATLVEMLSHTNEILQDMSFVEGNLPTGHKITIRTGRPAAAWRLLTYGVQPSRSATAQVTDTCGMLEACAEVDKALVELNGKAAAFRIS